MNIAAQIATPQYQRDPYSFYAEWRRRNPLLFDPQLGWLVTTYADSAAILRDARFQVIKPTLRSSGNGPDMRPLCEIVYRWLVCENPPDHTKLRRLVNHAFPVEFVSNRRA